MVAHWNYASIPPAVLDPASKMQATSQTGGLAFEDLISESACGPASSAPSPEMASTDLSYYAMGPGDPMNVDLQQSAYMRDMSPPLLRVKSEAASALSSVVGSPEPDHKPSSSSSDITTSTQSDLPNLVEPRLVILGIPEEGIRTRVETQMRVTFLLVHRDLSSNSLARVEHWKYLKIPAYTALKRKNKRHFKTGIAAEDALHVEVHVVKSSNPAEEVFICANCQERERKRSQRKKEARIRPTQDIESGSDNAEEGRQLTSDDADVRRIILFNCGEYVDFATGEVSMPVRVACYCRHHKEKEGFLVQIILRDYNGNEITRTTTPRILTTDDHKARPRIGKADSNTSVSRNASLESLASLASSVDSSQSTNVPTPVNKRPVRNKSASSFSLSSMSEALHLNDGGPGKASTSKQRADTKPYDSGGRPLKRASLSKSSMFSMTPMNSPPRKASPELPTVGLPSYGVSGQADAEYKGVYADTTTISPSMLTSSFLPPKLQRNPDSSSSFGENRSSLNAYGYAEYIQNDPNLWSPPSTSQHLGVDYSSSSSMSPTGLPSIERTIPSEGLLKGGSEVTLLGKNFTSNLVCYFGNVMATSTTLWSPNTIVCVSPAGTSAGPVAINLRSTSSATAFSVPVLTNAYFTYVDNAEKTMLELALQIVGMRSTGKLEGAADVAKRIIGSASDSAPASHSVDGTTTVASSILANSNVR